jgi:hypothetical protein
LSPAEIVINRVASELASAQQTEIRAYVMLRHTKWLYRNATLTADEARNGGEQLMRLQAQHDEAVGNIARFRAHLVRLLDELEALHA